VRWHQEAIMAIYRDLRMRRTAVDPTLVSVFLDKLRERFRVMEELAERHPEMVTAAEIELERVTTRKHLQDLIDGGEWAPELRAQLESFASALPLEFHEGELSFTVDFSSLHAVRWRIDLGSMAGKPDLSFLEIGSYEGRSACWLLTNILTHPSSALTCIDTFDFGGQFLTLDQRTRDMIENRFDRNIAALGATARVRKIKQPSSLALKSLPAESYDFIFVDGSHLAADVLTDLVSSWLLLKKGGLLTADDYLWPTGRGVDSPRLAIDSFLDAFAGRYEPVHLGYQVTVRKI
jgi:predicted O-methyltransferase YrrM